MAIEENFELNIEEALEAIERLAETLAAAVVDLANSASEALSQAIESFEVPEIPIPFAASIENAEEPAQQLEAAFDEVSVDLGLETDQAEANVVQLDESLGRLEDSATIQVDVGDAANELDSVADAASNVSEESKNAGDKVDILSTAFGASAIAAKGFAAAMTASFAAAGGLFKSAVNAEGALVGFNKQLGDLAPAVRRVEIGDLNYDLADLAQYLGSSDEDLLRVTQGIAQFGQSAGATNEQIAQTNSNLVAVAASIRSVNPAAGSLDQITQQLRNGMLRGGNALARYNIALDRNEIRMRAAQDTGKDLNAEFTAFELTSAAAALTAEQFGDSMQRNVEQALENPIIALERIKQITGDALEELGKPFVSPFLQIMETSIPVVTGFAGVVSSLAEAALPSVVSAIEKGVPFIESLFQIITENADGLKPAFNSAGNVVEALIDSFSGLLPVVAGIARVLNQVLVDALVVVLETIAFVIEKIGSWGLAIILLITQIKNLSAALTFLSANPVLAVVGGIALLVSAVRSLKSENTAEPFEITSRASIGATTSVNGLREALNGYREELDTFTSEQAIRENDRLVKALNEYGISVSDYAKILREEPAEALQILAKEIGGSEKEAAKVLRVLEGTVTSFIGLGDISKQQAGEGFFGVDFERIPPELAAITEETQKLVKSREADKKAAFEQAASSDVVTDAMRENILFLTANADGTFNYTKALDSLEQMLADTEAAQIRSGEAAANAAEQNRQFAEDVSLLAAKVADGTLSLDNLDVSMLELALDAEQAAEIIEALTNEMNEFVDQALANVPSVADAFSDLSAETGPEQIIANFNEQIEAVERWNEDMLNLRSNGQTEILNLVAQLGPQQSAILLDAYAGREEELEKHLAEMAAAEQRAAEATRTVALLRWLETREITGQEAERVVKELESTLTIRNVMEDEIVGAAAAVVEKGGDVSDNMKKVASETGKSFGDGTVEGVEGEEQRLGEAVEKVWDSASEIAQAAADAAANAAADAFNEVAANEFFNPTTVRQMKMRIVAAIGPVATEIGKTMMDKMGQSISANTRNVESTLKGSLTSIAAAAGLQASTDGRSVATSLTNGMIVKIQQDSDGVKSAIETLTSTAAVAANAAVFNTGFALGQSMGSGLEQGISSYAGRVASTAAAAAAEAERQVRRVLDSDSPSKVWARIGEDMMAGVAVGLSSASRMVTDTAVSSLDSATSAASSRSGGVGGISVTVPVTVMGNADPAVGREIGRLAANELRSALRMEARVA